MWVGGGGENAATLTAGFGAEASFTPLYTNTAPALESDSTNYSPAANYLYSLGACPRI